MFLAVCLSLFFVFLFYLTLSWVLCAAVKQCFVLFFFFLKIKFQKKRIDKTKTKRGEELLVYMQLCTESKILESCALTLRAGAEGRTGIFHGKIAVSAEIKKNRDWLRP